MTYSPEQMAAFALEIRAAALEEVAQMLDLRERLWHQKERKTSYHEGRRDEADECATAVRKMKGETE